jgi:hypothetical protein
MNHQAKHAVASTITQTYFVLTTSEERDLPTIVGMKEELLCFSLKATNRMYSWNIPST